MPQARLWGLLIGVAAFAAMLALPAPAGLSPAGWRVAALLALMVILWLTEVVPLAITALLPFLLLPLLGVAPADAVARSYGSPLLALVLGGSLIAVAAVKTGLHKRLAALAVRHGGGSARQLILAMMLATGAIAMWVTPGALSIFMIEIGVMLIAAVVGGPPGKVALDRDQRRFATAMVIGIAYAAPLGSAATLTGNPVNALAVAMIGRQTGVEIGYAQWMLFGVPVALLGVPLVWALLVHGVFRFDLRLPERDTLSAALGAEPGSGAAQLRVAAIGALAVLGWLAQPLLRIAVPALSDGAIATVAAILLFLLPTGGGSREPILRWSDAARVPWGVLVVIAGALALSSAVGETGLAGWLASPLRSVAGLPLWAGLLILVFGAALLTEVMSNFALVAIAVPAAIALAAALDADPVPFAIAASIAAGMGFIMPGPPWLAMAVETPPVQFRDLVRGGVAVNLTVTPLIAMACLLAALLRG